MRTFWITAVAACALVACEPAVAPPTDPALAVKREAEDHFAAVCVTCHGRGGAGDGPAGRYAKPRPRDWTDPKWQARTTDEHIARVIRDGGRAVGLSPTMPAIDPRMRERPELIAEFVAIVRAFGK